MRQSRHQIQGSRHRWRRPGDRRTAAHGPRPAGLEDVAAPQAYRRTEENHLCQPLAAYIYRYLAKIIAELTCLCNTLMFPAFFLCPYCSFTLHLHRGQCNAVIRSRLVYARQARAMSLRAARSVLLYLEYLHTAQS